MKNARLILSHVDEAIASGHFVFMTDGTVTCRVVRVEITDFNFSFGSEGTFDVLVENHGWKQIPMTWPFEDLNGYGLTELDGDLYIAPDWWIAL